MNPILEQLLSNAAGATAQNTEAVTPLSATKQNAVAQSAANKIAALSGSLPTTASLYAPIAAASQGVQQTAQSQEELDYLGMDPITLGQKYGYNKASEIIGNRSAAANLVKQQQSSDRNFSQAAADTVTDVGTTAVTGLGSILGIPAGIISPAAGSYIAQKMADLNELAQGTQSVARQDRRALLNATNQVSQENNAIQYAEDIKNGNSAFIAGAKRIGRGILDSSKNAVNDPINLGGTVAEGVGSLVSLAPLTKAAAAARFIKAAQASIAAIAAGKTAQEAAAIKAAVIASGGLAVPAAIGALEAGGSYVGTVNEVNNMTHEQLLANPDYVALIAKNVPETEARQQIANKSGLLAAAVTAPTAVLAGKLVSKFEGSPLKIVSARTAAANTVRETVEEGVQGGSGALAQNIGIQTFADKTKALSEGVGEQIGSGLVAGAGLATTLQAPSLALATGKQAANATLNAVTNQIDSVLASREEGNRKASPTSIENVTAAANVAVQNVAETQKAISESIQASPDIAPENKAAVETSVSSLGQALQIKPDELASLNFTEEERKSLNVDTAAHKIELVSNLVAGVKKSSDSKQRIKFGQAILGLLGSLDKEASAALTASGDISELPADVQDYVEQFRKIHSSINQSKDVTDALKGIEADFSSPVVQAELNQKVPTQETANTQIAAAELSPSSVNPAVAATVMKMASQGKLTLTANQKTSLLAASALVNSAIEYDAALKSEGLVADSIAKQVGVDVKSGEKAERNVVGRRSAVQHIQAIVGAMRTNNKEEAVALLGSLRKFAESENNKVGGINAHFADGKGAVAKPVEVVSPDGDFFTSKAAYGVTPTSLNSIRQVKAIAAEANFLTKLHNELTKAFPELGSTELAPAQLDAILRGKAELVVDDFKTGKRGYPGAVVVKPKETAAPVPVRVADSSLVVGSETAVETNVLKPAPSLQEPRTEAEEKELTKLKAEYQKYNAFIECMRGSNGK